MHKEVVDFIAKIRAGNPKHFWVDNVLDCGSLDINGSARAAFMGARYIGVDIGPGPNVDLYSRIHELKFRDRFFQAVISTECFEHDPFWPASFRNMYRMLMPGGIFIFTCATTGRPEHGTRRTTPQDNPLELTDYYKNLTREDFMQEFHFTEGFTWQIWETNPVTHDLYFAGEKA